ncbi:MAG TPA: hypothetical protein VIU87_00605, partial [Mycobacterium sp.]
MTTIDLVGGCKPTWAWQVGHWGLSNEMKPWHTGQANARMGHMVARAKQIRRSHMQLLLVRHALPQRSEHGQGSDPELSDV